MSDFAKKQLEKYGWSQGKGLGKLENGIVCPVKAKLKFDNQGLGHDSVKQLTSAWWYDMFNEASRRISVQKSETGVHISSQKRPNSDSMSTALIHKKFVKAGSAEELKEKTKGTETVISDTFFKKCEDTRKKCFNYSLVKAKINRVQKQEAFYEKRKRKKQKKKSS